MVRSSVNNSSYRVMILHIASDNLESSGEANMSVDREAIGG
jgi:hypothetical protein